MKNTTAYKNQYNRDHYKHIVMMVKPEIKERWVKKAEELGKSLTSYIIDCVDEREQDI